MIELNKERRQKMKERRYRAENRKIIEKEGWNDSKNGRHKEEKKKETHEKIKTSKQAYLQASNSSEGKDTEKQGNT